MATCPTCHADLPEGARFCQECGTPITPAAVEPQPPSERPADPAPAATVLLPPFDEPSATSAPQETPTDKPASAPQPPSGGYGTVLLPSVSPDDLRKYQEQQGAGSTQRLPETVIPDAEGRIALPGEPPSDEPPAIALPGNATPASNATLILPPDAVPVQRPTVPLSDDAVPSEGATIVTPSGDAASYAAPPAVTPVPVMPPPARPSYDLPATPPTANPSGTLPGGATPMAQMPAANTSRRQLYWILGGIGCVLLILLLACAVFALFVLGSNAGGTGGLLATATMTSVPQVTRTLRATSVASTQPSIVATESGTSDGILLSDDFSDPNRSGLSVGEDSETNYAFEEGVYAITVKVPRLLVWSIFDGTYGDVRAEVDTTLDEGPDDAAASLIFHYQDNGNFYVYNIAGDGRYNLEVMKGNNLTTLIDWTPSPAIKGKGEANRIRLETQGNRISLYANDTKLEELSDSTFLKGQIALAVNTFDQGEARVMFDNLLVKTE